jgi:hypothetical protein
MKNLLLNQFSCDLMTWEENPAKRNVNNEVTFYVDSKQDVNVGDVVVGNYTPEIISVYEILEVVERRSGAVTKKDYLTVKTKHSFSKPVFSEFNLLVNSRFLKLYNLG